MWYRRTLTTLLLCSLIVLLPSADVVERSAYGAMAESAPVKLESGRFDQAGPLMTRLDPPDGTYGLIGDVNSSADIDIDDVTYLINYIFVQGPSPDPLCTADVDDSRKIDIDDVVYLITFIFTGGPPPVSLGSVIPKPVCSFCSDGNFTLTSADTIWVHSGDTEALEVGHYLASSLGPSTGYDIQAHAIRSTPASGIYLAINSEDSTLGDEGYELVVTSGLVTLEANAPEGLFRGIQTIRQMLPNEIEDSVVHEGPWVIPGGYILDYPAYEWRGFLLDVSRHFFDMETIKEYIELLAYYRMNVFHWHFTDDQGWRAEIDSFPLLNEIGSWRGDEPYGGFYTKEEMQEVVDFAEARFIDVVPEIEIPGHSTAAVVSYPWLMCDPRVEGLEIPEVGGIYNTILCAGQHSTLGLVHTVLDEIVEMFPHSIIHIGGDEVPKDRWQLCPHCQTRIDSLGLADEEELQLWFMKEISWYLYNTHGRSTGGWSEGGVCQPGMPPGSQGQWWGPGDNVSTLAENGYDVVNSPYNELYLHNWFCTLPNIYAYDITEGTDPAYVDHILGVEAAIFTEFVQTESQLADKVFPRLIAAAECAWSASEVKNYSEFYRRLLNNLECLEYMGIDYGEVMD